MCVQVSVVNSGWYEWEACFSFKNFMLFKMLTGFQIYRFGNKYWKS